MRVEQRSSACQTCGTYGGTTSAHVATPAAEHDAADVAASKQATLPHAVSYGGDGGVLLSLLDNGRSVIDDDDDDDGDSVVGGASVTVAEGDVATSKRSPPVVVVKARYMRVMLALVVLAMCIIALTMDMKQERVEVQALFATPQP